MKRRIPKCLLENSIASCVLFCQYAGLDETDMEFSLLAENARRSFSAIGEEVGLSGDQPSPDRVTRLQETESSTTSLSMSTVADSRAGVPILVKPDLPSESFDAVRERVRNDDAVEFALTCAGVQQYCGF